MKRPPEHQARSFMEMLTAPVARSVREASTLVSYEQGQLIQNRGDEKIGVSIVKSGAVLAGVLGEDGSFYMTTMLGEGETFGEFTLFTGLPRTHDMTAATPVEIYQISKTRFQRLYHDEPEISRALLSSSLVRTHILLEMLDAIRRLPMMERTAKILFTMMRGARAGDDFQLRQSDLAHTLGVSRMSVNKALKELERRGLISIGYGHIRIPDLAVMDAWVTRHCDIALYR